MLNRRLDLACLVALSLTTACDANRSSADQTTGDTMTGSGDADTGDTNPGTPLEINGKLQVIGANLANSSGNPIQLRGMSSHGLQWFENCLKTASLDALVDDWGADVLRLSMYIQEGGYEDRPEYFRGLMDKLLGQVLERGIYAIIDWHQLSPGDPNFNLELAKDFFAYASEKHASKGNVIYEICNEPNGNSVDWAKIRSYAMEVIPLIRANDPDGIIIVGTPWWASAPHLVIDNELPFDNIMYTMHFYAADHGSDSMNDVVRAVQGGIPVFVTEFGTQEASGNGPNDFNSSQRWLDLLAEHKISWTNWNFSDDFRSGAVWEEGTCSGGPWTESSLKDSGAWIRDHMLNPPDHFPVN